MARKRAKSFTDVELEFMQVIWDAGEASPDDIDRALRENGRAISVGSIRNVLAIMLDKGYLTRRKEGKAFLYRAAVGREQARTNLIGDILSNMFEGSESLVVAALLDRSDIGREELEKMKHMIRERERREES